MFAMKLVSFLRLLTIVVALSGCRHHSQKSQRELKGRSHSKAQEKRKLLIVLVVFVLAESNCNGGLEIRRW